MKLYFEKTTNFWYRIDKVDGKLEIENKETAEAKWYPSDINTIPARVQLAVKTMTNS